MALKPVDIKINQGHTYKTVLRWELPAPIVYKAITAISQTAPLRLTVPSHGMVNGWNGAITGIRDIDTVANAIRDHDYHQVTVIDANTLDINDINAAAFKAYTSGGYIQYNTPGDLSNVAVRVRLWTKKGGTLLASSEVADGPLDLIGVAIDTALRTITITFPLAATELLGGKSGWYDVEIVRGWSVNFNGMASYNTATAYNGSTVYFNTLDSDAVEVTGIIEGFVKVDKE